MRILTRKIHRAYKELDQFEDEVCKRYVRRARRMQNTWKGALLVLLCLPLSFVLWMAMVWAATIFNYGLQDQYYWQFSDTIEDWLIVVAITGFVWFPVIIALLTRDRWLHRCIRKQLAGVQCPTCGYSLIGLALLNDITVPSVHCPECGNTTALKDMGLTQADTDPTLIASS